MKSILQSAVLLGLLAITNEAKAQPYEERTRPAVNTFDYTNALGARLGLTTGATYKHFISPGSAVEMIFGLWRSAIGGTALYQKHISVPAINGLRFYLGAGGHVTFSVDGRYYLIEERQRDLYERSENDVGFGIDGVSGLEYKINALPLALSFELKPFYQWGKGYTFFAWDPAFGIKVTF